MNVALVQEFEHVDEILDIDDNKEVLSKLELLCDMYRLGPEDLATKWDGLKFAQNLGDGLTMAKIGVLEARLDKEKVEKANKKRRQSSSNRRSFGTRKANGFGQNTPSVKQFSEADTLSTGPSASSFDDMLDATMGATMPKNMVEELPVEDEKSSSGPSNSLKRKDAPSDVASPSPTNRPKQSGGAPGATMGRVRTLLGSYPKRKDIGKVAASFNSDGNAQYWTDLKSAKANMEEYERIHRLDIEVLSHGFHSRHRFMHEELDTKRDAINDRMDEYLTHASNAMMAAQAKTAGGEGDAKADDVFDELASLHASSQGTIYAGGRVFSLNEAKLDGASNVALEGDLGRSQGHVVNLRLGLQNQYTLFPGQIVVAKGVNASGSSLVVDDFIAPVPLPKLSLVDQQRKKLNEQLKGHPVTIMTAAGPFTPNDNLNFDPLHDFLEEVKQVEPDVVLLMGPFIDTEHKNLQSIERNFVPPLNRLARVLSEVLLATKSLENLRIIVVPSLRDANHAPIFPQEAMNIRPQMLHKDVASLFGKLLFVSNPSIVRINDVTLGINNVDILRYLASQELHVDNRSDAEKESGVAPPKRVARLAAHLINQHSFYPLLSPTPDGINMDFNHFDQLKLPFTPDVMLTSSLTNNCFAEDVGHDVVAINMKSLTKFDTGGFYGLISIAPQKDSSMDINNDDDEYDENGDLKEKVQAIAQTMQERIRVELKRI